MPASKLSSAFSCPVINQNIAATQLLDRRKYDFAKENIFFRKVIFSSVKQLSRGDILIDDRTTKGAAEFAGRHIHFGSPQFPDWQSVLDELL